MIRFKPDTWADALLRPIAMAAPDGGVYVETIAPDFRFVFALALLAAWLVLRTRGTTASRTVLALLAFVALAFVPWLVTSGNGRYFIAVLLLAGPLCVGLLSQLRLSRGRQLGLLAVMLALQLFLVRENPPWSSWTLAPWIDAPAFAVDVPRDLKEQPATYVSINPVSYSLIAPQFHPQSRWISLASQRGAHDTSPAGQRTRAFLAEQREMYLVIPSAAGQLGRPHPNDDLMRALDDALAPHLVQLRRPAACRILPSEGLTRMGQRPDEWRSAVQPAQQRGFWLCPLEKAVAAAAAQRAPEPSPRTQAVFERLEALCPRLFAPGDAGTNMMAEGARRHYVGSDMRLYVFNEGTVMYKYMRALNPVVLGSVDQVLAPDFRMDCDHVRGRSGLPWNREI